MSVKMFKESAIALALKKAIQYINKEPYKNLPKVLNLVEKMDVDDLYKTHINIFRNILSDKNNNWYQLIKNIWDTVDPKIREKTFENFIIRASVLSSGKQKEAAEKYNCNIPWAILMDPTSACNLKCIGCWAAEYNKNSNLSLETLNSIIEQGKELGCYMYVYSGGEPLVRKDDIIKLCKKHQDCQFLSFTNATLIDDAFTDEMLKVKNFIPAISIEGFEHETDLRRGKGTYKLVEKAMKLLRDKKLLFGVSCCYTSKNTDIIGSEKYFDYIINSGAKFAWFFTYMPVGVNAQIDLMVSPEQRKYMYDQIRKFRKTKPIFTLDFWNDGEYVKGCIAGGRRYLHINANGDIEPCAFIHFSDSNIHNKTLIEALKSPLFKQYKINQPFNENHLMPCPLLDNPDKLSDMVHKSLAFSTDMQHPENIDDLCEKCKNVAKNWEPLANEIWLCKKENKGLNC